MAKIWSADIVYDNGVPRLANTKLILDNSGIPFEGHTIVGRIEPQNFRPPDEKEFTWTAYDLDGGEVMGCNLETGKITNYSQASGSYDEVEGIFPDGGYTCVESDRHYPQGPGYNDIYCLKMDGGGKDFRRLTNFNDVEGFKASNPVVRDDGRYMAFQESRTAAVAGVGMGLYLFDLVAAGITKPPVAAGAARTGNGYPATMTLKRVFIPNGSHPAPAGVIDQAGRKLQQHRPSTGIYLRAP
jgi:hypothetical protein